MTLDDAQAAALQEALDAAARFEIALAGDDPPDWAHGYPEHRRPIPRRIAGDWLDRLGLGGTITAAIGARLVDADDDDQLEDAQLEPAPAPRPRRASSLPPSRSGR